MQNTPYKHIAKLAPESCARGTVGSAIGCGSGLFPQPAPVARGFDLGLRGPGADELKGRSMRYRSTETVGHQVNRLSSKGFWKHVS